MGKWESGVGVATAALVSLSLLLAGCGGGGEDSAGAAAGNELDIAGYSAFESAYLKALEPAFERPLVGGDVSFRNSFGDSSDQAGALGAGQPASVVQLAQAGDMERLVDEGKVDGGWDKQPHDGIVANSVVVFVVRKGNPKQIHSLGDILSKDVGVVTPSPFSDDFARWNVMDVYATSIHEGRSPGQALAAVRALLGKTVAQPGSTAEAFAAFLRGQGDVLLAPESEAIAAIEAGKGRDFQFLVPHQTMLIETPIAVTKDAPEPAAEDFLEFLWSNAGQELWAESGFRPVNPVLVDQERFFPRNTFRISSFGGWGKVNEEFFDAETGSVAKIEAELGVPTGG